MAQIQFKGKSFVQNHHLLVKYHELIPVKTKSITNQVSLNDNLIIHGDNLKALKALLPLYAGKIKCIYIDPPYNTGNEKWAYNDNVNSPMMQEWLGKIVDREDLTRHDKWLCMMTPRLKLMRELLADNGAIFISIDDMEIYRLRMLLNDTFGEENFVSQVSVLCNPKGRSQDKYFATNHEYVVVYSKSSLPKAYFSIEKEEEQIDAEYTEEDEIGKYRLLELRNTHREFGKHNRKNLFYPFYLNTKNKTLSLKKNGNGDCIEILPIWDDGYEGCWTWDSKKADSDIELLVAQKIKNVWKIYRKNYANGVERMLKTIFLDKAFYTEKGQKTFNQIFNTKDKIFNAPKSVDLIKTLISSLTTENDIVLDSFAGSGTTAHAVLALNKEDGGNRKFIMAECEDYADKITAERVRRVIKGIPEAKDELLKSGLGGSFSFFELGKALELESILDGNDLPSYKELARYIFYTATGEEFDEKAVDVKINFIGESRNYQVYLLYQPDLTKLKNLALTLDIAEALPPLKKEKRRLVFAPTKYLDQDYLDQYRIDFCQLPFEIYERSR